MMDGICQSLRGNLVSKKRDVVGGGGWVEVELLDREELECG